jgi:hypothetical protein
MRPSKRIERRTQKEERWRYEWEAREVMVVAIPKTI